jgi:two-component system, NarL family, sensor histidine kinase UhpB
MEEPMFNRILRTGLAVPRENNTMLLSANNEWRVISNSGKPLVDENGKLRGALITFTDESDKKKREVQVKESEERYRTLVEEAAEAIFITDAAGVFLEVNQQAIAMLGYSREEILQLHVNQLVYQRERKLAIPADKKLRPGHRTSYECKMLHKQGQQLIVAFSARLLSDGRYMAIARDITNYRKVQKELSDYKYALDKSTIVTITDARGVITQANENFCKISGYSLDELVGQNNNIVNSGFHPTDFFESFWNTIRSGQVWEGEIRNKARNGNIFWVEATVVPFVDETGVPYQYAGVRKDITKRKEAEQAIQEILHRYDILMHATNDTIWDWDMMEDQIVYNEGIQKIFGYSMQGVVSTNGWWKENIHPDERLKVYEQLDAVFASGVESLQMEYRYKAADGTYKYIFDRAAVIYNKDGKPIRMIGVMQDITYRKETDRRIDRAILRTQEDERKTIGMELHDNVNQLLSASLLYLSMAESSRQEDPVDYATVISKGKEHIQEAIREIRLLSHQLAPVCNNHISIQEVYEALVSGIKHTRDIDVELHINGFENVLLSGELQLNLYRIAQEQLNNIVKYARCKKVRISLQCTESMVRLQLSDDGVGFDPKEIKSGIGLENIRRRAQLFSGHAEIQAVPGNGCTVIVELPLINQTL